MIDKEKWTISDDRGRITLSAGSEHSGVQIELLKGRRAIYVYGYYDHIVGIPGAVLELDDLIAMFPPKPNKRQPK